MKNIFIRIGIFSLALAIAAAGVIFIFRANIIAYYIPSVEQTGDIQIDLKNDTSYVSSKLIVSNKSFLEIDIDTIKYRVSLFDKAYLENKKFLGVALPGYGKDTIDFSLKIPYRTILNDLHDQRKKRDSASYSINISLQYSMVFGKAEFLVNKSARIKIPQPPDIEIQDIKFRKLRLKSILAEAKIKIINYEAVALTIKEMSYSMEILERGNLEGKYREPFNINPNGTTFLNLPIEINVNNIGETIFDIIINEDNYDYTLTLNAELESPGYLKKSFHIELIQRGEMELKK